MWTPSTGPTLRYSTVHILFYCRLFVASFFYRLFYFHSRAVRGLPHREDLRLPVHQLVRLLLLPCLRGGGIRGLSPHWLHVLSCHQSGRDLRPVPRLEHVSPIGDSLCELQVPVVSSKGRQPHRHAA